VNRILSSATVICYVIGTVCVLSSAAYWYHTVPEEDSGPVFLYTLYEHWPWFTLGLGGLLLVGMPPLLWFYGAIRSNDTLVIIWRRLLGG
jgi:hypothetical protein